MVTCRCELGLKTRVVGIFFCSFSSLKHFHKLLHSIGVFCAARSFQCKHSANELNQLEISSEDDTDGTGHSDMVMDMTSSPESSVRLRPSKEMKAGARASLLLQMRSSTRAGNTTGRNESECGEIGVNAIEGTEG
jgi:hypothetical protein